MGKEKTTESTNRVKFPVETLIGIQELRGYHRDFVRALLPEAMYTKKEAIEIVEKYFKGGKR